ncbi:indoleamine 2,3-dioxygenase 2 isoform X6 [Meriones unguiculatus]|uniref:indoleamine 2,3-dioxygenase 2 isoform X6 n=1 Tax=Meriones unguiculatus TaxID=10047 RepID=UPI00293F32FE|nr:indoleamine 2,3-dioxygenase 2 isoform X6 [Meriones unguiculatus]
MEPQRQSLKPALLLSLETYHISEEYGFLLPHPLAELPDHYQPWMEIANELPHLIESHQLRAHVSKMPLLDCRFLKGYRQQRLAHLVLAAITMGFVWQEGETQPQKVLPRTLAIPFVEVSRNLGLPPILVHSDLVLTNWTKRNPEGPLEISNLETIISFPGGESLQGFVLVTVLVEKAAAPGIKALVQGVEAILRHSRETLLQALQQLKLSMQDITRTLAQMHDCVDPDIFYSVIRIFLSGPEKHLQFGEQNKHSSKVSVSMFVSTAKKECIKRSPASGLSLTSENTDCPEPWLTWPSTAEAVAS